MVFSAPAPGVGSSKRPASCMQDDVSDRDNEPSMGLSVRSSINIPYVHYAMIYLDNMGRLKVMESPSIQEQDETVFTTEVREKFLQILGAKVGYQPPMVPRLPAAGATPYSYNPQQPLSCLFYRQTKRARNSPANSKYGVPPSVQFSLTVEETPSYGSVDIVGLKIGDTPKVLEYYERSLKHFRQFNCREVAKAFIKFIEPGKQVKHPYNGGKPPAGAPPGKKGDPEKTKPEWWPADVVHKEPDHLRRNQRLSLLIHIIRKLGRFGITTDQLQEIAHDCKRRLSDPHKLQILDEVFRVRRIEERYERGEVGANKIVYVVNRESNQKEKDNDSNVDPDQKHEQEDDNAREALPILYSEKNSTSPMSNSAEHTGMTAPRRPMNMEDCRNRLFPLPEWLSFSETPGDDQIFFSTTSKYTEDYASQQMPRTPTTTALVSTNDTHAAFNYMTQESITSSSPEQISHHRQAPLPMQHSASFDPWTPTFRRNFFNPMLYSTAPSHAMSQATMSYQFPRSPMSHPQEVPHMAHGLPNLRQDRPSSMDGMTGSSF
ncbi:hypothetical protein KXV29_001724 [Aspergillus fumigatus]|nr:hypothetical protein KXX40_004135 [Aspergillus fumigatus]KAH1721499.1 hypothetical protein KXX25_002117 [Aspergillus fumigatus]KAH2323713.1 hypothetical protein KXV29_001724 [Aspergillus fumigatus]KAH2388637.1 hypothetical protein KXW92_002915 [Aspergillus fumigatus]KAH2779298.1 hypothetical protein KXW05_004210 [Aspergillus fumigatus]